MSMRVLFVDDDQNVLSGLKRNLRKEYDISIAIDGASGLKIISKSSEFAVVVSDYKMPGMDGNVFLSNVAKISPNSSRILLTGYADMENAIDAVNQGKVFRFLTKPCSKAVITDAINAGIKQYRLINAEKDLLQKTLNGSIKMLVDVLAVANPEAFSKAKRICELSKSIGKAVNIKNMWELEISALLSQIGLVALPHSILDKISDKQELSEQEENLYMSHPVTGSDLLRNIPRLEGISEAIKFQFLSYSGSVADKNAPVADEIPIISRILKLAIDVDNKIQNGLSSPDILTDLIRDRSKYDPALLKVFKNKIPPIETKSNIVSISIERLRVGMTLLEDIRDNNGLLLISRGSEVSDVVLAGLRNYSLLCGISDHVKVKI